MKPPIPLEYWKSPTQAYGVVDCGNYPKTCRHIGVDFATPLNTPHTAPTDCVMTRSGYSSSLGFWCELKIDDWYMVDLHLKSRPVPRAYKQGEVYAYTGASGTIYGVHSHLEGWIAPRDANIITKKNWNLLTFDVRTKFPVI